MREYLKEFLAYIKLNRHVSPHTVRAYESDITQYLAWVAGDKQRKMSGLTVADLDLTSVRAHLAELNKAGKARSSVARKLSALRTFVKYLRREELIAHDPTAMAVAPKRDQTIPTHLSEPEMARLIEMPSTGDPLGRRDRAILELFYASGLRLSELVGIDLEDLNLSGRMVRVMGKGGKERLLPFNQNTVTALRAWLADRAAILAARQARARRRTVVAPRKTVAGARQKVPGDPLFLNSRGGRLTGRSVDTYNTFSLDYITQQGMLREGYIDWGISDSVSLRGGRFILPIGFAPRDIGAATAKDMTRITRLNAEANFGAMLAVTARRGERAIVDAGLMAVLGDGNREKDYDWFYFVNTSLDTNSAVTMVASARLTPIKMIDVRAAFKKGYTGSKVERLPSYWASKRNDDALVVSVKLSPTSWASVFGEYAKYKWGPTVSSGELVGLPALDAIVKPGYFMGALVDAPIAPKVRIGGSVVREELSRDDSLVQYLELNHLYGVTMGKMDRALVVRGFVDVNRLVNVSFFWMDVSNPYPWTSGSWPVTGPVAFTGRDSDRIGVTVTVRTP